MTVIAPPAPAPAAPAGALPRQFARFLAVGVLNTVLFLGIYLTFRIVASATIANALSTILTTVAGTRLNGKMTFGITGHIRLSHHVKSFAVTGLGIAITSGAITTIAVGQGELSELTVLVLASMVAGAVRFVLLRYWVFAEAHQSR